MSASTATQPAAATERAPASDSSMVRLVPPLYFCGGTLVAQFPCQPFIHIQDSTGARFDTRSVEWLLRNIDHFSPGRDQSQALAQAAWHLGFDNVYALMGRDTRAAEALQHGEPA